MKRISPCIILSIVFISSAICVAQDKAEKKGILQLPANDPCASVMFVDSCPIALYQGKVISVLDGQTIEIILKSGFLSERPNPKVKKSESGEKVQLRLAGISAPMLKERLGKESRRNLEKLLLNRTVRVTTFCYYIDGKNGWRAGVEYGSLDAGLEQVKAGFARYDGSVVDIQVYRRCHYDLAEKKAKAEGVGIWRRHAK